MYYKLEGHNVVPATMNELQREGRHVGDTMIGGVRVSTVFLGLDHRFGEPGPPIVFETMIFGSELNQHQWRYCTWDEAEAGHAEACERVRALEPVYKAVKEARQRLAPPVVVEDE